MSHLALDRVDFAHPATPGSSSVSGARRILADASLELPRGSFTVLRGPSGAGKSTTLRLFCRLEEPSSGRVLLSGADIATLPPALLRRRVAYLQQTPVTIPGDLRANLLLPFTFAANAGLARPDDAALLALLARLNLPNLDLAQEAATLSVGQRQRLCLARAMLLAPEVLLLDEPTSALDPESAAAVLAAAEDFCLDRGVTTLLVSHTEFTPARVAPLALHLENGDLQWTQA